MITENKSKYSDLELKHALTGVFRSIYIDDFEQKMIIQDSYFLNFRNLTNYARENNLDEKRYIRSIRKFFPGSQKNEQR